MFFLSSDDIDECELPRVTVIGVFGIPLLIEENSFSSSSSSDELFSTTVVSDSVKSSDELLLSL